MFVDFNILNQLGSPSINSNTFANRPAAGQRGRLFVSTDTFEIYRDNGTTWDLIGGPGSSTITGTGTATQVAFFTSSQAIGSNANFYWDNVNERLGIGTITPSSKLDIAGNNTLLHLKGGSNAYMMYHDSGVDEYKVGYTGTGGPNYRRWSIYDESGAKEVITIDKQSRYVGINYQYSSLADQPAYTLDVSGSGRFTNSAFFATDNVSNVGINTTNPVGKLDILSTTIGINNITLTRYVQGPHLIGYALQGTISTPTAILSGNELLKLSAQGYNGTGIGVGSIISFVASENFTSIANGSNIEFYTTTNGTTSPNKIATFTNDGNFNLGNSLQNEKLSILGPNISGATVSWQNTARTIGYLYSDGGGVGIYQNSIIANGIYFSLTTEQYFYINGSAAINIKTNQNVLIGTTTDTGQKLQVNGVIYTTTGLNINTTSTGSAQLKVNGSIGVNDYNQNTYLYVTGGVAGQRVSAFVGSYAASGSVTLATFSRVGGAVSADIRYDDSLSPLGISYGTTTNHALYFYTNNTTALLIRNDQTAEFTQSIKTAAPTTGTAAAWKLGQRVAAAVVLDATQYIEVEVGGTFYKLAIVT